MRSSTVPGMVMRVTWQRQQQQQPASTIISSFNSPG
jgi:hypothetical protein